MRIAAVSTLLIAAIAVSGCSKTSATFASQVNQSRPAPVIGPGTVNPPMLDPPRISHEAQAIVVRTIPSGTTIQIRNNEAISMKTAQPGQTFPGVVARDVMDGSGHLAIPRGSVATLVVLGSRLLDIGGVVVAGRQYGLEASKRGDAGARAGLIPAATLLSFRLDEEARIRELH